MAYSPEAAALILNSCNDEEITAALQSNPELFARLQNLPKAKAPPPQVLAEMASSSASQPSSIAMAVPPPLQVPQALQMGVLPRLGASHTQHSPLGSCQYQHRLQRFKALHRRCQWHHSPAQHRPRHQISRSPSEDETRRTAKAGPEVRPQALGTKIALATHGKMTASKAPGPHRLRMAGSSPTKRRQIVAQLARRLLAQQLVARLERLAQQ